MRSGVVRVHNRPRAPRSGEDSRRVEESKACSTDGESDESDESDRRGLVAERHLAICLIKSDESDFVGATPRLVCLTSRRRPDATPRTDESLPPDESGQATRPTSGTSTVGQVSRSRSDSGRRVDSSYTRPKSNVTRASEAATSRIDSDASWTWLIYAHSPPKARTSAGRQRWWWWWPHISNTSPSRPLR